MVKQKPSESDMISRLIAGALPAYSDVMKFQNLLTFNDVNTVGLKIEKELQSKKPNTSSGNFGTYRGSRASRGFIQTSSNIAKVNEVNAVSTPPMRKFSNFRLPLSVVFKRLRQNNLLKPIK